MKGAQWGANSKAEGCLRFIYSCTFTVAAAAAAAVAAVLSFSPSK